MSEVYTYNATHLTTVRERTSEFTQPAELGGVGSGKFVLDDTAGTQSIVGQKDFLHTESSCSQARTFRGFIEDRVYSRDAGISRAPATTTARGIEVSLVDLNASLGFRLIDDVDGKRSSETVAARMTWLLASDYVTGLFIDNGRITSVTGITMDKADYRNQYPGDVLADMALAAGPGFNYHVSDYGSGPELIFRNDNTSTADTSTLRISNVSTDVDSDDHTLGATKTFAPSMDARLTRRPGGVYSKVAYSYAKGTTYAERAATATAFNGERGGVASNANVKTLASAVAEADDLLLTHSSEEDIIEVTIQVPAAAVNLLMQGYRISCKFSHLTVEGYGSFTYFRVLERRTRPMFADALTYEMRLKLSPQETVPVPETCDDLYPQTPSDTYYPLGGSGNIPNVSDGVVFYWRAGFEYPGPDDAGLQGSWHFPAYSAGGVGNIDYAGDCTSNRLIFVLIGNGTAIFQTEMYAGSARALNVKQNGVLVAAGSSGDPFTVEITDRTDGDCVTVIEVGDTGTACGGKWGFSELDWTLA